MDPSDEVTAATPPQFEGESSRMLGIGDDLPDSEAETEHLTLPAKRRRADSARDTRADKCVADGNEQDLVTPHESKVCEVLENSGGSDNGEEEGDDEGEDESHSQPTTGRTRPRRGSRRRTTQEEELSGTSEPDNEDRSSNSESSSDETDEDERERQQRRLEARESLAAIEIQLAAFRDRLHTEQVVRFDLELAMCTMGTHPELANVYKNLRKRYDHRISRGKALLEYQSQCISNQTAAMRCHVYQQFLKDRFEIRERILTQTTHEWYQVNYERRAADNVVPEFGYRAMLPHRRYNIDLIKSTSGHLGFPAAPDVPAASINEQIEDLTALGLSHIYANDSMNSRVRLRHRN